MPSMKVQNLSKRFGEIKAVDDLSFEVEKGELFGLLGPNGAGKSTAIRMLTGVLRPYAWGVETGGMDMRKNPLETKDRLGVIPEVRNVYTDLIARENLELFGHYYGLPRGLREERA